MVSGRVTSARTGTTRGVVHGTTDAATTSSPSDAATSNAPSRVPARTEMPRDRHSRTTSLPVLPEAPMTNTDAFGGMAEGASSPTRPVWARAGRGARARDARARGTRGTARIGDPAAKCDVMSRVGRWEKESRDLAGKRPTHLKKRVRATHDMSLASARGVRFHSRASAERVGGRVRQHPSCPRVTTTPPPASSAAVRRHPAARGWLLALRFRGGIGAPPRLARPRLERRSRTLRLPTSPCIARAPGLTQSSKSRTTSCPSTRARTSRRRFA